MDSLTFDVDLHSQSTYEGAEKNCGQRPVAVLPVCWHQWLCLLGLLQSSSVTAMAGQPVAVAVAVAAGVPTSIGTGISTAAPSLAALAVGPSRCRHCSA
jgi:hypothetical protein